MPDTSAKGPTAEQQMPLLWTPQPERYESSPLAAFIRRVNRSYPGVNIKTYEDLHRWSVESNEQFWLDFWDFTCVRAQGPRVPTIALQPRAGTVKKGEKVKPIDLPEWFPEMKLNYTENLLFPIHPANATACEPGTPRTWPHPNAEAIIEVPEPVIDTAAGKRFVSPSGTVPDPSTFRTVTWGQLREDVARLSHALRAKGVKHGDRIAHVSANTAPPFVTMLAAFAVGAVWSGLATDAGEDAIYRRFEQTRPTIVFTDDVVRYGGKTIDIQSRIAAVASRLVKDGKLDEVKHNFEVITVRRDEKLPSVQWPASSKEIKHRSWDEFLSSHGAGRDKPAPALKIDSLPFGHPAIIVFTSGSTGEPKSIVHSHGAMTLMGKMSGLMQLDKRPGERSLTLSSLSWIMFYHQFGVLFAGGCTILIAGGLLYPDPLFVPRLLGDEFLKVDHFVTSPRWLSEVEKAARSHGIVPKEAFRITRLKTTFTTGAPLSLTNARFLYDALAPASMQLQNNSGGTDVAGVIVGGWGNKAVYGNLLSGKILGADVRILDSETGEDIEHTGEAGELCIANPCPNLPRSFFGTAGAQALHDKLISTYYAQYDKGPGRGVYAQGDYIFKINIGTGAYALTGRSDATLNPAGVRFGSGDIYNVVEKLPYVENSICVGQRRKGRDDDERVLLFVKTKGNEALTKQHIAEINSKLRTAYSPRHVPAHTFQVADIPITVNLKKVELAVKAIINGANFKPSSVSANCPIFLASRSE